MDNEQHQEYSPNKLFITYQHLAPNTLYRMLGQPYSVARSKSMEYNDLLQYANEGLWKACITYDSEQSSFESHAINHIRWSIKDGLNREGSLIKYNINNLPNEEDQYNLVGYDNPISESEGEDYILFSDITPNNCNVEKDVFNKIASDELLQLLSKREKEIIKLKSEDKTDKEIAKMYGVTYQAINSALSRIKRKLSHKKEDSMYGYS